MTATRGIEQRLAEGVVLGAEGYVFELERRGYIKAGPYVPEVVLDFPGAVRELHQEFLRAGADVMVALTYYAHREKLRHIGRENDLEAMNRSGLTILRPDFQETILVEATTRIEAASEAEIILLCVKTLDTENAARAIAPGLAVRVIFGSWAASAIPTAAQAA